MEPASAWWLFLGCAFLAEVIGTMAGFGAATILTPIASLFMDVKTAIAIVACFHLFGNASRLIFFGRHINWRVWAQFGLIAILFSALGARVTTHLSSAMVALLFGVFLLSYVGFSLMGSDRVVLPKSSVTLMGGGVVSGFIAGLIGTGGAIRSACLLVFGLPKEVYIGTSAAIALIVDSTRLPVYLAERLIPVSMAWLVASLIVAAFAGAWVGQRLVHRMSAAMFRRFVLMLLAVMGLKLLLDGWREFG